MTTLSYLTVPAVSLALLVLGCGQVAPTTPTESEVVLQPSVEVAGTHDQGCCPLGFELYTESGNPVDRNGDCRVCRKVTPEGTVTIDNNTQDFCPDCVPPACGC